MPAPNGPRQRISTGRNRRTLQNIASKGGNIYTALQRDRVTGIGGAVNTPAPPVPKPKVKSTFTPTESLKKLQAIRAAATINLNTTPPGSIGVTTTTPSTGYTPSTPPPPRSNMTALALLAAATAQANNSGGGGGGQGPGGPIMRQLARGFRSADDPRMARFVKRNKDLMRIWLGQESGMDPKAISPPNNQGDPNYGLFQFARLDPGARPWLERFIKGSGHGRFTATPYQQARLAAKYFDLTPADVRRYVREIQAGTYKGWG